MAAKPLPEWAGDRIEAAIKTTCPKMKSQLAGKMGYGTREVGDLVCAMLQAEWPASRTGPQGSGCGVVGCGQ